MCRLFATFSRPMRDLLRRGGAIAFHDPPREGYVRGNFAKERTWKRDWMSTMSSEIFVLPRPAIARERAEKLADEVFGVVGEAKELGSQQDRNFLVTASADG